ncbi:MAG: helix-turn-helix domain-containing protein [Lachnospiraceae bacterium]
MDQVKIGKFIARCRKEQNLTQMMLAEKLGITDRAVSKWETGRSMPDSSVMLELCDLLSINVNELLRGERIMMEDAEKVSEELVITLKKREEEQSRTMLHLELFIGLMGTINCAILMIIGVLLWESEQIPAIVLMAVGILDFLACVVMALFVEQTAGFYECAECGHCHKPTFRQVFLARHIGRSRKMVCPACGKKSYQKKVLTQKSSSC